MKLIKLTQGKFAKVDDHNYEYLNQWKWHYIKRKDGKGGYAARNEILKGKRIKILMHHLICPPFPGEETDHRDGHGTNNADTNLRSVTHQQNTFNRRKLEKTASKYKGVFRSTDKTGKPWRARIGLNYKRYDLGYHNTEKEAAFAYNDKAIKFFGHYAKLNIIK